MFYLLLFLLGLFVGSFLSAFTYRYPRGIQFWKGRSFCPRCKKQIAWFDNIPLVSFLLLRGRCRNCQEKISLRYPLIELATGVGFVLIGWDWPWLVLFLVLLSIFVIDFENQVIPDSLVFGGLFLSLLTLHSSPFTSWLAGFTAASALLLVHLVTKGKGMGLGDVKFAVLGGMIAGLPNLFLWLFLAFLTGAVVGVILILGGKKKLKDKIAFGPFLVAALAALPLLSLSSWFR